MQFTTTIFALAAASIASAAPAAQAAAPVASDCENGGYFTLRAIRSGSAIQNSALSAAHSSIFVNLPSQNSSCDADIVQTYATFTINNGELDLYTTFGPAQKLYVDRSGMGQGKLGYTTDPEIAPTNSERTGWAIRDGYLYFGDAGLIACPDSIDKSWSVWVSVGLENPAGNVDCIPFAPSVSEVPQGTQVGCSYTSGL